MTLRTTHMQDWDKQPGTLIEEIKVLDASLALKREILRTLQTNCQHQFSEPKYDPIVHDGYQDPGDPPGTMGVDWRGPVWVPRVEIAVWKRTCNNCLLEQKTRRTADEVKKVPVF